MSFGKLKTETREIESRGEKASFIFRQLSAQEAEDYYTSLLNAEGKYDIEKAKGHRYRMIELCVKHADGKTVTAKEAGSWPNEDVEAVFDVAVEINNAGKKAGKS